jgi:hypothetical protein
MAVGLCSGDHRSGDRLFKTALLIRLGWQERRTHRNGERFALDRRGGGTLCLPVAPRLVGKAANQRDAARLQGVPCEFLRLGPAEKQGCEAAYRCTGCKTART